MTRIAFSVVRMGLVFSPRADPAVASGALTRFAAAIVVISVFFTVSIAGAGAPAGPRQMENLGRGVVALNRGDGKVYVGWRLLGTDPDDIAFNLYRSEAGGAPIPIVGQHRKTTDFVDASANLDRENSYFVRPLVNGVEGDPSAAFTLRANAPALPYLAFPLKREPGDHPVVTINTTVGDLDGDGEYEYIVRWTGDVYRDPGKHSPSKDTLKLEAYKLDGTRLWRIDLGPNILAGTDFFPSVVYDLDGDGKAEVIAKSAEGTVAGDGTRIGDSDADGITDYRDPTGRVNSGPEFVSVFCGLTGKELARSNWIARGSLTDWGDSVGNRANRNHMAVAYLDGVRPSVVAMRGDYALMVMEAWNFRSGKLTRLWNWSSGDDPALRGKGSHMVRVGDVNGDGKDEILRGALTMGPDGKVLYTKPEGHGDEFRLGDLDPDRPGLEVWMGYEKRELAKGVQLYDAATGECLWGYPNPVDLGKSLAAPLDGSRKGYQFWSAGVGLYDTKGNRLTTNEPAGRHEVWWDADLCRELVIADRIEKYDPATHSQSTLLAGRGFRDGSGEKGFQGGWGDVLGDWREEIFAFSDNELRIYSTAISASNRLYTLMHDPNYRLGVAMVLQRKIPTSHPGFYLGPEMPAPPRPAISTKAGG
jgi:rhamnogalacturonan endolyase